MREPEETSRLEDGALCRVRRLTLPPQLEMSLPLDSRYLMYELSTFDV